MPIPQIKKANQSWRKGKKKDYAIKNPNNTRKSYKLNSKNKPNKFSFKKTHLFKNTIKIGMLFFVIFGLFIFLAITWLSRGLPNPNQLMDRQIAQSTKIYDRTGETILYEIHGNEQRTIVDMKEMPEYIKWATISIEDKNFYDHGGISLWGIFRGIVWQKIRGKGIQGGSTLTQQLVKNAILTPERTIKRKIKEWILAYKIEQKYTKDEILQMYFNEIPYGSTAYGIEAASMRYFNKNARNINIAEAAILAALPQAPSRYSPYGANKELLIQRQHYIIDLMFKQGYIPEAKAEAAKLYELKFKKQTTNIIAPHFVMHVKELLSEKYGEKMIEQGGLKITTTLDLYKQEIAEEIIEKAFEKNKQYNASNTAMVSIDPKTGQVLTMVGSRDYFNEEIDGQVNITTSLRQPGSSLKPLVYASSFLKGYTPNTILYDVVTNFSNNKDEPYEPHNYDSKEHGPVTIRKALAGSLNIPAVKAIYLAGIDNVLNLAEKLNYSSFSERDRFGLSLVLGGGEVKLLEHTNAFSVFAREGVIHPISTILKIEDKDQNLIEEFKNKEKNIIDSNVARMINDILSDNQARAYAFGESNWLNLESRPVAAKTGTTNDYRDAWTIGYTPSIVTGVWVGNNNNTAMKQGAAGGVVAAPIWHDYMKKILGNTPIEYFKKPTIKKTGKPILDGNIESGETIKIDKASGLLATEWTPKDYIEEKKINKAHSILYYVNKNKPTEKQPKNPEKDPQFELWESRVLNWAQKENSLTSTSPTSYDNLHKPENNPKFQILYPKNNQTITNSFFTSEIKASAPRGIKVAKYYINDNLIFSNTSYPFNLEKQLNFLVNGYYNLKIRVCDDINNCSEQSIEFNLILENEPKLEILDISFFELNNGLAITNIDFPLTIKIKTNKPEQIAKINLFYKNNSNENITLIKTIKEITNTITEISWQTTPLTGTYTLYAEATEWTNQTHKTKEMLITVTNNKTSI